MISRLHRFHGHNSVRRVYREGQGYRGSQLGLKIVQRSSDAPWKLAVVVSRKVHKSAVVRNRIRRRVFECVRTLPVLPKAGSELVLTVFADQVANVPYEVLRQEVQNLLQKSGAVENIAQTPVARGIVGKNNEAGD